MDCGQGQERGLTRFPVVLENVRYCVARRGQFVKVMLIEECVMHWSKKWTKREDRALYRVHRTFIAHHATNEHHHATVLCSVQHACTQTHTTYSLPVYEIELQTADISAGAKLL